MVNGSHVIFYAKDADKVRSFFKDVLQLGSVDAGHGWLIFALPPAEFAVHPTGDQPHYELYLMCDDIHATMKGMKAKGVEFARPLEEQRWGSVTAIKLPGGGEMGLYEPRHPTALNLNC
jgi:catechol 2,3-dioxygenase-like lactoylglutathione lyase family enzyme